MLRRAALLIALLICLPADGKRQPGKRARWTSAAPRQPQAASVDARDAIILLEEARIMVCEGEMLLAYAESNGSVSDIGRTTRFPVADLPALSSTFGRVRDIHPSVAVTSGDLAANYNDGIECATIVERALRLHSGNLDTIRRNEAERDAIMKKTALLSHDVAYSAVAAANVRDGKFVDPGALRFWTCADVPPRDIVDAAETLQEQVGLDLRVLDAIKARNEFMMSNFTGLSVYFKLVADALGVPCVLDDVRFGGDRPATRSYHWARDLRKFAIDTRREHAEHVHGCRLALGVIERARTRLVEACTRIKQIRYILGDPTTRILDDLAANDTNARTPSRKPKRKKGNRKKQQPDATDDGDDTRNAGDDRPSDAGADDPSTMPTVSDHDSLSATLPVPSNAGAGTIIAGQPSSSSHQCPPAPSASGSALVSCSPPIETEVVAPAPVALAVRGRQSADDVARVRCRDGHRGGRGTSMDPVPRQQDVAIPGPLDIIGAQRRSQDMQLDVDLDDFVARTTILQTNDAVYRQRALYLLTRAVGLVFPRAIVLEAGSGPVGLHLYAPISDLDVVIVDQSDADTGLSRLYGYLTSDVPAFCNVVHLARASTPVLKMALSGTMLSVDVTWNAPYAAESHEFLLAAIRGHTMFKPIVMYVKYYLFMYGLGTPYYGGVGSYLLYLLVLFHIQVNPEACSRSTGTCLRSFFEYYGSGFDMSHHCISVVNGGRIFNKRDRVHRGLFDPSALCVEHPFDSTIDVGRSAFNFAAVRRAFYWTGVHLLNSWKADLARLTPEEPVDPRTTAYVNWHPPKQGL
ncbi:PAP-associated domain-containing protein [Plasmodiophora brassicae]